MIFLTRYTTSSFSTQLITAVVTHLCQYTSETGSGAVDEPAEHD